MFLRRNEHSQNNLTGVTVCPGNWRAISGAPSVSNAVPNAILIQEYRVKTALVWFRRDLRLTDNPALLTALTGADRIVPVYIHDPDDEVGGRMAPPAAGGYTTV